MIVWSLCVIASKPTWGVALCVYCFCPVRVTPPTPLFLRPPPVSVCSLPLLCSLSEDWGEPVSSCDEGLLRDAASVHEPGEQRRAEVTGRWRGSVQPNQPHQSNESILYKREVNHLNQSNFRISLKSPLFSQFTVQFMILSIWIKN